MLNAATNGSRLFSWVDEFNQLLVGWVEELDRMSSLFMRFNV